MSKTKTVPEILDKNDIYRNCLDVNSSFINQNKLIVRSSSNLSIGFSIDKDNRDEACQVLADIFLPNEKETRENFSRCFKEATSGSGQEIDKINALHSSSLCALLFFFNVCPNHPIVIDDIEYDKVLFEYENKVFPFRSKPSSMDVVLTSSKQNAILFLESKFSEYLTNQCQSVSKAYFNNEPSKSFYESLSGLYEKCDYSEDQYHLRFHDAYSQGIKQIIAHLAGITNFVKGKYYESERRLKFKEGTKVYFQEIVFELNGHQAEFDAYQKLSEKVRNLIGSKIDSRIVWKPMITYRGAFKANRDFLQDHVKAFYRF